MEHSVKQQAAVVNCCYIDVEKNDAKHRHLCTIAQPCGPEPSQLRHVSTVGKNLLSSNMSSTCSHMANFGPLAAEIGSGVWGTPASFNGFRVLAVLLHATLVEGVSQTSALNRVPRTFVRAAITLGIGPHFTFSTSLLQIAPCGLRGRK